MSERIVSIAEVRDLLAAEMEKRGDLINIQKSAMTHAQTVAKLSVEQTEALVAELSGIENVTGTVAYKIADVLPKYSEEVRTIFAKERITLDAQTIDKIIETVGKYL